MNSKIEYALVWKEVRQSGPIVAAFSLLTLIIVSYLCWLHNYSPQRETQYTLSSICQMLYFFTFFISLGLAYMMAAGNRILEANDNLENFLFIRPIERFTLIRVYSLVGLAGIVVWFFVLLMLVYLFFGSEIFAVALSPEKKNMGIWILGAFTLFISYTVAFGVSLVSPSLTSTSVSYVGSFAGIVAGFILMLSPRIGDSFVIQLAKEFSYYGLLLFVLLILVGVIAGTIFYYQKKQVR